MTTNTATRSAPSPGSFVLGTVWSPAKTFEAARAEPYWGTAFLLACLLGAYGVAGVLIREDASAATIAFVPVAAGLTLLGSMVMTSVAVRICGGDRTWSGPTASQASIASTLITVPSLLAEALLTSPGGVTAVAVVAFVATLWVLGILYGTAFDCGLGQAILAAFVGQLVLIVVVSLSILVFAVCLAAIA